MLNHFLDRVGELRILEKEFRQRGGRLVVMIGRRRLGKTTLLRRFIEGKPAVYHCADRTGERDAIRALARSMSVGLGEPTLQTADHPDWDSLFASFDRVRGPKKTVLILDEFQYLCELQPALPSILQRWWDEHWQHSKLMVVLCGSLLSLMQRQTLAHSSPLYGRTTASILLSPMRFREVQEFFPGRSPAERLDLWSLTGGVPRYAKLAAEHQTFSDALRELVLTPGGGLAMEARFLLRDEVTTPNVYASLLMAVASGVNRISELGSRLGVATTQLPRYLGVLQDLGFLKREVPVTEPDPIRSKKGLYRMTDPFLRLWYGVIAPVESLIEIGRTEQAFRLVQETLRHHHAWAFEEICRQFVEKCADEIGVGRVGRAWNRDREIDIVGLAPSGEIRVIGECKRTSRPIGRKGLQALEESAFFLGAGPQVRKLLFSSGGFTSATREQAGKQGVTLISPDDLCSSPSGLPKNGR